MNILDADDNLIYDRNMREYTIVGITAVFDAISGDEMRRVYIPFQEVISLVLNGAYYHCQVTNDRERVSRNFLRRVAEGFNLEVAFATFDKQTTAYEQLLALDQKNFTKETILQFFAFYRVLIPIAYTSFDSADYVDELPEGMREPYLAWATRVRRRGEFIYKEGEMDFAPKLMAWLADTECLGYTKEQLLYATYYEMRDFCRNGTPLPAPAELDARKECFYFRQYDNEQYTLATGDKARELIARHRLLSTPSDTLEKLTELKGQTAQPGMAQGRVCIVRRRADMDKFHDGDVLVSQMTDPSFLPVMKRAVAFVTNEGGLLCHAAIVARELKKPCVIGTKYATHFLKDGDMVEVDANSGIVKKIV